MDRRGAHRGEHLSTREAEVTAEAVTSSRRFHERRGSGTAEVLLRDASRLLSACGVHRSGSWILRTVSDYCERVEHTGYPFGPWLVARIQLNSQERVRAMNDPEVRYCLEYSDPTGETAVRNVMRRRHG
jgi:hypothetical protein